MRYGIVLGILVYAATCVDTVAGAEVRRQQRPSATIRALKYGPLFPFRLGIQGVGRALNHGLVIVEDKRIGRRKDPDASGVRMAPVIGGFAQGAGVGGGIRLQVPAGTASFEMDARISRKLYQDYGARFVMKARDRIQTGPEIRFRSLPEEDFYGLGSGSPASHRSDYALTISSAGWLSSMPLGPVEVYHAFQARHVEMGAGTDGGVPAAQELFSEDAVGGGFRDADWIANEFGAVLDRRDNAVNPKSGYAVDTSVTLQNGIRRTPEDFSYFRTSAFAYFPLTAGATHVLGLRADLVRAISGETIPFYAQPAIGGSETLRGFREYRFRDRDALTASVELRYGIWRHLDMTLFGDVGQVYSDVFSEVDDKKMQAAFGLGLRLNGPGSLLARLSAGHSREGTRLFLTLGPTW